MAVRTLRRVQPGTLTIEAFEEPSVRTIGMKQFCGIGGGSTVTDIESENRILVDTGFDVENNHGNENRRRNREILVSALAAAGIEPGEIDHLFITPWHADHFMNYPLFSEREIYLLQTAVDAHDLEFRGGVSDGQRRAEGVSVLATPGHTRDHASLVCRTEPLRQAIRTDSGGRIMGIGTATVVVAGDAVISPTYCALRRVWTYNADFFSEDAARASIEKITDIADFIIPGHGSLFAPA